MNTAEWDQDYLIILKHKKPASDSVFNQLVAFMLAYLDN